MNSPWSSGPKEILKHGLSLLAEDTDSNRRLAMMGKGDAFIFPHSKIYHLLISSDAAEYRSRNRIRPVGAPHGRGASIAGEGSPVDGAPGAVRNAGNHEVASRGALFSFVPFF